MSVSIDVPAEDWRRPEGEPAVELKMRAFAVAVADPADPEWVLVRGYRLVRVTDDMPEIVTYLVRWSALPAEAQALLPADEGARHARP